jgi:hypothetical protein
MGGDATNHRPFRDRAWTIIRLALGVLLLTAAGLKLAGQNVSAVPQVGWYATPTVQIVAAEWEIVLGVWLLSGRYRIGSWLAALSTFLTFASISGYLGWIGVASCGCFGSIQASPWHAFGVDAVASLVLALFRPDLASLRQLTRTECRRLALTGALYVLASTGLMGALLGVATLAYGSSEAALAHVRGDRISVYPSWIDLGTGQPLEGREYRVELVNRTDHPIRIVGGVDDCACVVTNDLPQTLNPKETKSLRIVFRFGQAGAGAFTRKVWWMTDDPYQRNIVVRLAGRTSR